VGNSIGGGYIFQSDLIPHSNSHPRDLDINCEVFINAVKFNFHYRGGEDADI